MESREAQALEGPSFLPGFKGNGSFESTGDWEIFQSLGGPDFRGEVPCDSELLDFREERAVAISAIFHRRDFLFCVELSERLAEALLAVLLEARETGVKLHLFFVSVAVSDDSYDELFNASGLSAGRVCGWNNHISDFRHESRLAGCNIHFLSEIKNLSTESGGEFDGENSTEEKSDALQGVAAVHFSLKHGGEGLRRDEIKRLGGWKTDRHKRGSITASIL